MAKRSTRPVDPFWYVLPADQKLPGPEQSRFRFRPLTQAERLDLLDNTEVVTIDGTGARQLRFRNFAQAREVVLLTLIETENFPAGEPDKYPAEGSREEKSRYLAKNMDDYDLYALGQYVFDHSTLGTTEKNSSTV